jgi:hypothetical protein
MRVTALSETRHHDTARSSERSTRLKIAEKRPGRCGSFSRIQGMLSWRCLPETCRVSDRDSKATCECIRWIEEKAVVVARMYSKIPC